MKDVVMHDGSIIQRRKLGIDYEPRDKYSAMRILEEARDNRGGAT